MKDETLNQTAAFQNGEDGTPIDPALLKTGYAIFRGYLFGLTLVLAAILDAVADFMLGFGAENLGGVAVIFVVGAITAFLFNRQHLKKTGVRLIGKADIVENDHPDAAPEPKLLGEYNRLMKKYEIIVGVLGVLLLVGVFVSNRDLGTQYAIATALRALVNLEVSLNLFWWLRWWGILAFVALAVLNRFL